MKLFLMRLRSKRLWLASCAFAAGLVVGCSRTTNSEPRYNGHTLSEWLTEYEAVEHTRGMRETNAIAAIRAIGSNAVPYLVEWINVDYTAPEKIMDFSAFASGKGGYEPPRIKRGNRAMRGFEILGTNAASAIPGLTNIVLEDKRYNAVIDARDALVYIGPPGFVALGMLATNPSTPHRFETITTLGLGNETGPRDAAKPFLTNCLADPDPHIQYAAGCALAEIAQQDERRAKGK